MFKKSIYSFLVLVVSSFSVFAQAPPSANNSKNRDIGEEVKRALAAADMTFKAADKIFQTTETSIAAIEAASTSAEAAAIGTGYVDGGATNNSLVQWTNRTTKTIREKVGKILSDVRDNNVYKLTGLGLETSVASYNVMRDIKNMGDNMESFWSKIKGDNISFSDYLGAMYSKASLDQYLDDQYQATQSNKFNMLTWYDEQTSAWRGPDGNISVDYMLINAASNPGGKERFLSRISQLETEKRNTVTSACRIEIQTLEDLAANLEKQANSFQRMLLGRSFARNENIMALTDAMTKFKMNQAEIKYKESLSDDGTFSDRTNNLPNESGQINSSLDLSQNRERAGAFNTKETGISSFINNQYKKGDGLLAQMSEIVKGTQNQDLTNDQRLAVASSIEQMRQAAMDKRRQAALLRNECLKTDRVNQFVATSTLMLEAAGESNVAKELGF